MKRNKKGLTLIELLLALGICSILALTIYGTFSAGITLNERAKTNNKIYREIQWTLRLIEQDLQNMRPYDFSLSYPDKSSFLGSADKVIFLIDGADGLKAVSYYLLTPEATKIHKIIIGKKTKKNVAINYDNFYGSKLFYLVREEVPFIESLNYNFNGEGDVEILSTNLKNNGLEFSYGYKESPNDTQIIWKSYWNLKYNPLYIKIDLDFQILDKERKIISVSKDILTPLGSVGLEQNK